MTTAPAVTGLYRSRLAAVTAVAQLRLGVLWLQQFNPADPLASLAMIGGAAGPWVHAAQDDALAEAAAYLRGITAAAARAHPADVAPYDVPQLGGTSAMPGVTVEQLAQTAPNVYVARMAGGASAEQAASATSSWLNRITASEPYRAANQAVTSTSVADERLTGRVARVTRPGACTFCQLIADRGYIAAHAGFAAHAHCSCTASPEVSSWVTSASGVRRARAAGAGPVVPAQRPAP